MSHDSKIRKRTIIEISISTKWLLLFFFQIQLLAATTKAQQANMNNHVRIFKFVAALIWTS